MGLVTGPFYVAAALLAISGVLKVRNPGPTMQALRSVGLPSARPVVLALGAAELAVGASALLWGGRLAAVATAIAYAGFAGFVILALVRRSPLGSCGCFGLAETPPSNIHIALNLAAAVTAGAAAFRPVEGIGGTLEQSPGAGSALVVVVLTSLYLVYLAFTLLPKTMAQAQGLVADSTTWQPALAERLAYRGSRFLEGRMSRRSFLSRAVLVGAALSVAPVDFILKPRSAYAAICSCSGQSCNCGSMCCDGYTEFCCTITGSNSCPPGSIPAGWWKADGSGLCDVGGVPQPRYYFDCNAECDPGCGCGSSGMCSPDCIECDCHCAGNDCGNRKECCTSFRYGQCNADVTCIGAIVCRVVTCTPPWQWDPACGQTVATDNNTRWHDAPCLHDDSGRGEVYPPGGVVLMGDWTGSGVPSPGIFRDGMWYLHWSNADGPADRVFAYGDPGDTPVVGDWNGDGVDTPGVVRAGKWYLRNSNSAGAADLVFSYGDPGDTPVVGDWNGDGVDTPGVVRGDRWLLHNANSSGPGEIDFRYGNPSDVPVAGDWDGDGRDSPGVVRGSSWYLRNRPSGGIAHVAFTYGSAANQGL